MQAEPMHFDGSTYVPERDQMRLTAQAMRVWAAMVDGQWRTLREIAELADAPETSVSARLRDFRKQRFGSHVVEREFVRRGLFRYRLIPNPEAMKGEQHEN
jgi:hypothetical protein